MEATAMSSDVDRVVADLLGEALGKVLQIPYAAARKGTPEFDKYWTLADPALQAMYFALETVEPAAPEGGPQDASQASADSGADDEEGDPDPQLFPPLKVVLSEAHNLLERVLARLPDAIGLDDEARTEIAGRCSVAQESLREIEHYSGHGAP
jgi:hypothetical protein